MAASEIRIPMLLSLRTITTIKSLLGGFISATEQERCDALKEILTQMEAWRDVRNEPRG